MNISECMSRDVKLVTPGQNIREAARLMADIDAGILPVADNDRLVGMITDRDIAVRAVANGKSPDCPVREVMSQQVLYCYEDESVEDVARNMGEQQVRRLPVVNRQKRLVGIVSLGDLSHDSGRESAGEAISQISAPGGQHSQSSRAH
jgi:CBS domain-containing protein